MEGMLGMSVTPRMRAQVSAAGPRGRIAVEPLDAKFDLHLLAGVEAGRRQHQRHLVGPRPRGFRRGRRAGEEDRKQEQDLRASHGPTV